MEALAIATSRSASTIGGKAANLFKLKGAGVLVPEFTVLEAPLISDGVVQDIKRLFPETRYFAVRSSALCEDSAQRSHAGQFYTAIGVELENIPEEARKVQVSFGGVGGSVIIQEFIAGEKAGVMFSSAVDGTTILNANRGICDPVVKGWECDEYSVNERGRVIRQHVPASKRAVVFSCGRFSEIPHRGRVLNDREIQRLHDLGKRIEQVMGCPQDVEWCISRSRVYCLQSRPITRSVPVANGRIYFDSANIAESYSGVVLPLTFSFARSLYKEVYKSVLAASGVARKTLEVRGAVFDNLLGTYYGRMYYNMNNWYTMLSFLPGYRRNKENLETMITSNIRAETTEAVEPSVWLRVKYPFLVAFKMMFLSANLRRFGHHVSQCVSRVRSTRVEQLDLAQCKDLFLELQSELLKDSYLPVENDFLVMTYFGILRKGYPEQLLRGAIGFGNISVDQIESLQLLAREVRGVAGLWRQIERRDEAGFKEQLSGHGDIKAHYEAYLQKYGGRFASELKLETDGIEESFERFAGLLKLYAESTTSLEKPLSGSLPGNVVKRTFFNLVLERFRTSAARREELRLLRANVFGLVRRIVRRMGWILAESHMIGAAEDVFYLSIDELLQARTDPPMDYNKAVEERKREYGAYGRVRPPSHFSVLPGEMPEVLSEPARCDGTLIGRPCTPGQVRGRVRIFREFSMPDTVDFEIVVARQTDPGWTPLIGLAKGLIVERGGILSHASIVSRELGIPTIIGVSSGTDLLQDGQAVDMDGSTGRISILG